MVVLKPNSSEASFSPIYGKGITGPWAVSIDGNDNIWIANLTSASAGAWSCPASAPNTVLRA
ncbi:MAG TPA: hypothetical protein VII29_18450 [Terriglobales bacterium]